MGAKSGLNTRESGRYLGGTERERKSDQVRFRNLNPKIPTIQRSLRGEIPQVINSRLWQLSSHMLSFPGWSLFQLTRNPLHLWERNEANSLLTRSKSWGLGRDILWSFYGLPDPLHPRFSSSFVFHSSLNPFVFVWFSVFIHFCGVFYRLGAWPRSIRPGIRIWLLSVFILRPSLTQYTTPTPSTVR